MLLKRIKNSTPRSAAVTNDIGGSSIAILAKNVEDGYRGGGEDYLGIIVATTRSELATRFACQDRIERLMRSGL